MTMRFLLLKCILIPFIKKCEPSDSKCVLFNTVNTIPLFGAGIPELDVEPLDPLYIGKVDASTPNLKLVVDDLKVEGLKDCQVLSIEHDKANLKIYLNIECTVDLYGKYDMDGQLLVLKLQGNGNAHFKLRNTQFNVICEHNEKIGKDGKLHYNIKNTKYTYDLKGKVDIELENLLQGNEVLAAAAREVFTTNANIIADEIAPKFIKAVVDKIVKNVNNFFHAAAVEDIEIV
ncbi:hypothetical protein ABMA28_002838 [Loxostege sticticalis]|uniref:Uncharacterized protein n=1 Tax=Loxostege sticticalis TaxID=481309 RepID=A0ABD0SY73_LOXSC